MTIKPCNKTHLPAILDILNDAIIHTTSIYDYRPRTMEKMRDWYEGKLEGNYPVIGAFIRKELVGFVSYGKFRANPAYKYTVEHSVYVKSTMRGKGIGKTLLMAIIAAAIKQDYHVLVGGIDSANTVSIKLHEKLGFTYSGTVKHAGYKFGKWLDVSFYQLILPTPKKPVEG
jgi:L-amino acid N-acyltransferase